MCSRKNFNTREIPSLGTCGWRKAWLRSIARLCAPVEQLPRPAMIRMFTLHQYREVLTVTCPPTSTATNA